MSELFPVIAVLGILVVVYYYLERSNTEKNKIEEMRQKLKETYKK